MFSELITQLENKPYIYICIEAERALAVTQILKDIIVICYENSPLIQHLRTAGHQVFSIIEEGLDSNIRRSTSAMLGSTEVAKYVQKVTKGNPFYLQTFQASKPFWFHAQKYPATLINNNPEISEFFENKVTFQEFASKAGIPIKKAIISRANQHLSWNQLTSELGHKLVLQIPQSHTGEGTFIVTSEENYTNLKDKYFSNDLKISEYIEGEPWTINGVVYKNNVVVRGLSYQYTGIKELTNLATTTVGNDWSAAKNLESGMLNSIADVTKKIGKLLTTKGFRGLYGIDFVLTNEQEIKVLEVNARQTANLAMQTELEINSDKLPLMALHIAEFSSLSIKIPDLNVTTLEGAQLFNRAKQDTVIHTQIPIGHYQKGKLVNNLTGIESLNADEYQILASPIGIYSANSEIARIQSKLSLLDKSNKPFAWAIDQLSLIERKQTT